MKKLTLKQKELSLVVVVSLLGLIPTGKGAIVNLVVPSFDFRYFDENLNVFLVHNLIVFVLILVALISAVILLQNKKEAEQC